MATGSTPAPGLGSSLSSFGSAGTLGAGIPRISSKTITFTGASGLGLHATNTVWFTQAGGLVLVRYIAGRCTTDLAGAGGTLTLGVVGQTGLFIAATTATTLLSATAELWVSTTATLGGIVETAADVNEIINANIVSAMHATNDITGGVLELNVMWMPLTPGATLV